LLVLTWEHPSFLLIFGVDLFLFFLKPFWLLVYELVMALELWLALQWVVEMDGLPLAGYKTSQVSRDSTKLPRDKLTPIITLLEVNNPHFL
jgi:hypothetical protein